MRLPPQHRSTWPLLAAGLLLALASPAAGVDGVIEVNQVRALAGGIAPGDTAGFPVTITRSGSYRLTGNLDVREQAAPHTVTAIYIEADNVTIDLNGFAVIGPVVCSGTPVTCSAGGAALPAAGVGIDGNGYRNIAVVGGAVRGMGSEGLDLGEGAIVRALTVTSNARYGIRLRAHSIVSDCTVSANGADGAFVNQVNAGVVYIGNTARGNATGGLTAGPGSVVWGNTTQRNGGDGIYAAEGSTLLENAARLNAEQGLRLLGAAGYGRNVLTANLMNAVLGGVEIGGNVCNASSTCP